MTDNLSRMSKAAFYAVEGRKNWIDPVECNRLVLLPPKSTRLHESGYRFMDAVACFGEKPVCRVSGCSDVFHLEQPNELFTPGKTPSRQVSFNIDCLSRSGLFCLFVFPPKRLRIGGAVSSLYIHPVDALEEA